MNRHLKKERKCLKMRKKCFTVFNKTKSSKNYAKQRIQFRLLQSTFIKYRQRKDVVICKAV